MDKVELILTVALVIVFLFSGGKKLPKLAEGVGEAARESKKALTFPINQSLAIVLCQKFNLNNTYL
ncbi:MAG: twin-arginine translocase TatA/TatE family subunit [Ignavibacteria bacterium]|nr:twin-arginine translocase TatA/TatE family subunit [Ignavibacteria bacterium]